MIGFFCADKVTFSYYALLTESIKLILY